MGQIEKINLSHKELIEQIDYNHLTGIFIRKVNSGPSKIGDIAGYQEEENGYISISINGKQYRAHRLAWFYVHGYWPENQIDHKDQIKHHNWISNLREASDQCQRRNTGIQKNNTSGIKGVSKVKSTGKWRASITIMNKTKNLGHFTNFDEAVCVRLATEQCLDWEGCDSNSPAYKYVQKVAGNGNQRCSYKP